MEGSEEEIMMSCYPGSQGVMPWSYYSEQQSTNVIGEWASCSHISHQVLLAPVADSSDVGPATGKVTVGRASYGTSLLFYRALHYSAKCGLAIACRLSVCPSVCDVGGS